MGNSPSQNHLQSGNSSRSDLRIFNHSSVIIGDEIFIWGGSRPGVPSVHDSPEKRLLTSTVDVLNVGSNSNNYSNFVRKQITGTPPNGVINYSCCCIGSDIYYFGGSCGTCSGHNNLFVLNTKTYSWRDIRYDTRHMDTWPIAKEGCGMVPFSINGKDYLLVIGGRGPLPYSSNPSSHVKYAQGRKFMSSECFNNEVHIICVSSPTTTQGKWTIPVKSDGCDEFPPSAYFSINHIPGRRSAIIFGGMCIDENDQIYQSNSVFILGYTNYSVSFTRLDPAADPSIPWPETRSSHSSVIITSVSSTGAEKHHLVVIGGYCIKDTSSDLWIMDIEKRTWKQISIPKIITERRDHSISCHKVAMNCVRLIITGGRSDMLFGYICSPNSVMVMELVCSPTGDDWAVSHVLNEEDLKNGSQHLKSVSNSVLAEVLDVNDKELQVNIEVVEKIHELKQQLKDKEKELELLSQEIQWQRRGHQREMQKALQEKDHTIRQIEHAMTVAVQEKNESIERKEAENNEQRNIIQQKDDIIQQKDDVIQQKQHIISTLEHQLQDRPWILGKEEVRMTDERIGGGAYGEVRVAVFRGTRVAAKCLHDIIVSDYNLGVFTKEMEISARIHHPNIVQFIGATRVDNPILLYELMTTSLHKQLQERHRPLTRPQIITIASNICTAMCYLHQWKPQPIIHRDISSPNVLMEPLPDEKWRAKLSDFGSANIQVLISKTDNPGNISYAAPEARDPQSHSPAMDVYSFGILVAEMILNRQPLTIGSERELQVRAIDWLEMRVVLLKCIDNNYKQRLSSEQLLTDIQEL